MVKRNTGRRDRYRAMVARGKPDCWICGQPIDYSLPHVDPKSFVIDHVVPLAAGGADTLENVRAAHRDCNRDKSDKPFGSALRVSGGLD